MITVLAEKPSVAKDIAAVLGAKNRKDGFFEGNGYYITWAFGHLVGLANPDSYNEKYKSWNSEDLPIIPDAFKLALKEDSGARKQFKVITNLFNNSKTLVNSCDAAAEGSLIFEYILKMSGVSGKTLKRLWINSVTSEAIKKGFENLQPLSNYELHIMAARARSEADWLVGLNGTRAFTTHYSSGKNVLSVGRVQTPVLAMIVNRAREIQNFKPESYWEIITTYRETIFKFDGDRFFNKTEAESITNDLTSNLEIDSIERKVKTEKPPQLFDLTTLQRQMNQSFNLTATKTLAVLQSLYEKKFVTYPRTDSRYLSDDIYPECSKILNQIKSLHPAINNIDNSSLKKRSSVFNDSKVSDHHAVIPTGQLPTGLTKEEQDIYNAVLNRFVIQFTEDCKKSVTKVTGKVKEHTFTASGTEMIVLGWREWVPSKSKDVILPNFQEGESGTHSPELKKGITKAPSFYNEASLLGAMELAGREVSDKELREIMKGSGVGTPATRASIIETLLKRNYIQRDKKFIKSTAKGDSLIDTIKSDTLKSPELTGEWEKKLSLIENGKLTYESFIDSVKEYTNEIVSSVLNDDSESSLAQTIEDDFKIADCPICGKIVSENSKAYGCEDRACKFVIWKESYGKKISRAICIELIKNGQTKTLKGFLSKDKKKYDAALKLEDGKVILHFDKTNRKYK